MMMWFGGVVRSEEVYVRKTEYERKGEGAGGGGGGGVYVKNWVL